MSDHDGDEVTFNIQPSASPFPGFKDASAYFIIIKQSNTAAVVKLAKSIQDVFEPGDQLTLSITAEDGRLTTRSEVFLTIEEKQHLDPIPDSFNPLLPHLNNRERIPEDTESTTTKDELQIEVTEMTPKESAQAMTTMWSVIVGKVHFMTIMCTRWRFDIYTQKQNFTYQKNHEKIPWNFVYI